MLLICTWKEIWNLVKLKSRYFTAIFQRLKLIFKNTYIWYFWKTQGRVESPILYRHSNHIPCKVHLLCYLGISSCNFHFFWRGGGIFWKQTHLVFSLKQENLLRKTLIKLLLVIDSYKAFCTRTASGRINNKLSMIKIFANYQQRAFKSLKSSFKNRFFKTYLMCI